MFQEEINLFNFAEKHKIKVSIFDVLVQKHPLLDKDATFYRIRISRGRKSFLIIRNKDSFGLGDKDGCHSKEELTASVLASLPRFEPLPFQDYCREFFGEQSDTPIEKIKKAYDMETSEYKEVIRLFPDIMDELIEIIQG